MLSIIIVLVSICFIGQLFNLQIINGKEYRENSQKRMLRTETISAPRGQITDRNGVVLAQNKMSNDIELYKVDVTVDEQNEAIAKLINILYKNSDEIYSTFPVNDELNGFNFANEEEEKKWKEEMELDESLTFEQAIDYYIKKYALEKYDYDRNLQIRIIEVKYEGNLYGYSLFKSATIAKDISDKSLAQIEERKSELYGVVPVSSSKRYYPISNIFSHILGYVGKIDSDEYAKLKDEGYSINSIVGKTGIEQTFDKYLKGEDGEKKVETDSKGNVSSEYITKEPVTGSNIRLTIDYRLQKVAQEALETTIEDLRSGKITGKPIPDTDAGSVVVLDCQTGEVLAMVNYPNYDNNLFVEGITNSELQAMQNDKENPMSLYNRAISGMYSPGSTFKMLVGIAGLQSGKITVDEKYYDPGVYPYGYHPKCWLYSYRGTTHGWINILGAIKGSCNCYFYEVGRRIGIAEIVKYAKLFGLGEKTGIELPGEYEGQIVGTDKNSPDGLKSPWYLGDTLSAAIGQSSSAYTPLQLANYISVIANGGTLNKVSIIKEVENESTNESLSTSQISEYAAKTTGVNFEARDLGINEEYLNVIKEGMLSVTNDTGGTANIVFKNSNIKVAGKTGTSEGSGTNNGLFVGFAPYENPKIAVVAVIEHGEEGTYTANVVKPIMEEYFKISTEDKNNEKAQNVVESGIKY